MAQSIIVCGNTLTDVPGIDIPKTTSGMARFMDVTDTTATASDVTSGKYFYAADGTRTLGTNSGGGGASNFVTGTFTTGGTGGVVETVNIPYTRSGYPLMITVVIEGGAYNPAVSWYSTVHRYAVGEWTCTKCEFTSAPTYSKSGSENFGVVNTVYKNSANTATTYARSGMTNDLIFTSSDPANSSYHPIRYHSGNVLAYFVASTSYGLLANCEYRYFIAFSE